MYAKISIGVNFSLPSLGHHTCKVELKTVKIIQMNMHKCYNAADKKHASMRAAEKAVTQWSGKAHQRILLGKGVVQQLPL